MALQDLAQRSGFTHAVDNVVFLQLELPSSQPELRELFSCQLAIDDGPINDPRYSNEWRKTNLYEILKDKPSGRQSEIVGTVHVPSDAIRNWEPVTQRIRQLSLFGSETLLENVNPLSFTTNLRVRCLSLERTNNRIWLVRGEILSGGLMFSDPRVIDSGDLKRVWPNPLSEQREQFRGIFFTGSELQIEVGSTARRHAASNLPNQNGMSDDRVRVNIRRPNGPLLFRSKKNESGATWGEWKSIFSWTGSVLTVDTPYGAEQKPRQGWDYEVYHGERIRRFHLLGASRNVQTGAVQRAVWEQISASAALSQLLNEPPGLPIEPPANTVDGHFKSIEAIGSSLGITLKKQEQSTSRSIVVVDGMDGAVSTRREFLHVDWNLSFDGRIGNVSWLPQTLLVHSTTENNAHYELIDRDEAQSILNAATSPAVDNRVQRLTFSGTLNPGVKFKIRFKDDVSGFINWSPNTESLQQNVQNALNTLSTIGEGNTRVSQSTSPVITFISAATNSDLPLLEAESVSAGANVVIDSLAAKVQFKWNRRDDAIEPIIPDTRLIGTPLDADRRPTQETPERSRELWFQASCASGTPYAGSPLGWANVSAQQPPAVPVGDGARAARLSGPIVYTTSDWTLEATPADPDSGRATETPGVRLILSQEGSSKTANFELFAADVTLDSPRFRIYSETLNDPKSVPNERRPQDETVETSLRFIYRPEWERVRPGDEQAAVVCNHQRDTGSDKFVISRAPQAVRLYLPAERALVDPVSVTRGNLVGRQIVAFPLLSVPDPQSTGVTLTVTDVRTVTANDKSLTAQVDLQLVGAVNADDVFRSLAGHKGFFAQFGSSTDEFAPAAVLRIRDLTGLGDTRTLVSPILAGQLLPLEDNQYRLTVGPTRLALPRDVNHGLIPIGVSEFQINPPRDGFANLSFAANTVRGEEGQSVLALHPWSEWGPRPEALTDPKRPWLTTGRVRLHHRNLVQEHAEFESSFEDRFPPEGPAKNPDGSIPSPLLPLADFVRAVRDRYTEATGNVIAASAALPSKKVRNWFPNSKFTDAAGQILNPQVEVALNANDLTVLPKAEVKTDLSNIEDDPFSFKAKVDGTDQHLYQSLKLRKTHKADGPDPEYDADKVGSDRHWLDVSVRPEELIVGRHPQVRLAKTDPTDVTSRRALDSSVPLLFSRHDICALATIGLDDGRCIAIVGSPEQSAMSYLFAANGSITQSHTFPGDALVDVALLRHEGTIRGLAIRKTNSGVELIRFTIDSTSGAPTIDGTAITVTGTPMALACTAVDSSASIYVLTSQPDKVYVVNAESGSSTEIAGAGANATAIDADFIENVRYLAVGTSDGTVSVWRETANVWSEIAGGEKRLVTSPLLGGDTDADMEIPEARSIRGLCVQGDAAQPSVVAVDGTRFPCVWGIDKPFPTLPTKAEARIWLQSSGASSVSFGRVQDLEQRPRFKITDDVITELSQSGVPAEAIHSLEPIKDKEFLNRTEFEQKLRELLDAAHEIHLQTIADQALVDSTVPFIAIGLRSGSVRVCAAIGRSEGLTDIRQFDTSETPVTRLSLAGGSDVDKPAVCFAGTSTGGLQAWDARRGMEWPEAPTQPTATIPQPVTPTTYLDALGVVRAMPNLQAADGLTVDDLSHGTDSYYSLTTRVLNLVVDDADGTSADDLTDIRLWADSFKVLADGDGTVEPRQFPNGPFDPGHIAFFSNIKAVDGLKSLSVFDHVPRLSGIPFFVTGVNNLELKETAGTWSVKTAIVEGVLINPDEIAAGQDPADAGTLPGVVARALSRGSKITIKIESRSWSVVTADSLIDWTFAVNRQEPSEGVEGFPSALARIRSKSNTVKQADNRLCFEIDAGNSRGLVFGRLWPLSDSVQLVSHATFRRSTARGLWEQTGYSFGTSANNETLSCEHRWEPSSSNLTISADPKTLVWSGGRYISFHQAEGHKVFVADRTTGLAVKSSLFEDAETAPEAPTTAVLEAADENGEITLTVAAGRVSTSKNRVEFAHWKGESLAGGPLVSTATKASWVSEKLVGCPIVRLYGPGPSSGEVDYISAVNNLARLHAKEGLPFPASGSILTLTTPPMTARVFGVNRESREFSLAQDVDADEASNVGFLQFVRRIETAVSDSDDFRLTLSDSGPTFAVDDRVRVIADGNVQIGKVVDLDGPIVSGLTSAPEPGSRLQSLFAVTDVVRIDPDETRATVRLKTNTVELVDRFICIHTNNGQNSAPHLAVNFDEHGFDLFQPVELPPLGTEPCAWRAVHPTSNIPAGAGESTINVGTESLPSFTRIKLTDIIGDTTLNGEWDTIPVMGTTRVLLCQVKKGDGTAVTDPGTWSVNGSDPIPVAAILNNEGVPIVVTTTDEHGLTDGDIVEIAGVVGPAGINGPARIGVESSTTFRIYQVADAPSSDSSGLWERLDQDEEVTDIAGDQFPAVLTATKTPAAESRFRLVLDSTAQVDVYVAGPILSSTTTWEALSPVSTFDKDSSYWSPMVLIIPGDGSTAFLRTRSVILPETVSTAALAYDRLGKVILSEPNVRVFRINRRGCYLAKEVSRINDQPTRWSIRSLAVAFVPDNANLGKRLLFDEVPASGELTPAGTTAEQDNRIAFLEVGRCGGRSVAITVDDVRLNVWPIDVPVANIEQTQTIPVPRTGNVLALAVHEVGEALWVAVVRGNGLSVYRLDDAHCPAMSISVADVFASAPATVLTAFTEHEGDVVVAVSDGTALKTWRVRVKSDGTLNTPEAIWGRTKVKDSIISLSGGQDGGAATLMVGFKNYAGSHRVESWSPTGYVAIQSDEPAQLSPRAALGVNFDAVTVGEGLLTARLHPSRRVRFNINKKVKERIETFRAFAQLEQGNYRCLTLHPTTPDASRGGVVLTLWTTGDLGNDALGQTVGPLELCAASVELQQTEQLKKLLKFTVGVKPHGSGHEPNTVEKEATVYSRSLLTYVGDQVVTKLGTTIIDIPLYEQTVRILLESDVRSEDDSPTTGVLMLLPPAHEGEDEEDDEALLQAVVRCSLDLAKGTLKLEDDVYWTTVIVRDKDTSSADILLPEFAARTDGSTHFSVTSFQSSGESPRGFARLNLTHTDPRQLGTVEVDKSLVPLMPELEPSLVQAPDRISDETVRLAHRLRAGLAVRPTARTDYFLKLPVAVDATRPTVPTLLSARKSLLLETVVTIQDGPLIRLRPEGWLVPKKKKKSDKKYRTDGLFVLNVDFPRDDIPVVCAVEARTREFDPAESGMENERGRYRHLLRAVGVQGVAINYRLTDGQEADLGFIDSPFYDHAGDFYDNAAEMLSSPVVALSNARTDRALALATSVAVPWVYGFDPRLRLPGSLGNEQSFSHSANRYMVADLSADPYADVCCLAHRQYRLQRLMARTTETFDDDIIETPILHNSEVPAFRQPARLSSPLSGRWLRTKPQDYKPSIPRVFFPPRVDWELAADKPGAMFQSVLQARVTTPGGSTRREPLIDFALREPQFIRLAGCVTAEVYWQAETKVYPPDNGYADVNLVWTEVVGSVQVDDEESGEWLKPTATGIALSRTPLQLVIDFNSEVFLVNQADAAVPAYRVEAQPDGDEPSVKVLPAATFLVANPDVATVFTPQTVANEEHTCIIDNAGKATVTGLALQSGTALTLTGFSQVALDDIAHRFVGTSGGPSFDLMQDTATEDDLSTITVDGTDYTVMVRGRRPLCVTLGSVTDPNPLNGKILTIPDALGKVRRLRNGEEVTALRLAQVAIDQNQFLIVTPTEGVTHGEGKCRAVATQADGFLETAIRVPAKVAADPSKAWTPAFKLSEPAALEELKLVGEHKLVRLESKNPAASGVFGVLGPDNLLARPVVGNGQNGHEGTAREWDGAEVQLDHVEGSTPIVITLKEDRDWSNGTTPISVIGVVDVPQANGTWVVSQIEENNKRLFALYEPTVATTADELAPVASAIIPLREAFVEVRDRDGNLIPRLRRLDLDPKWMATDRPLLQVHWIGASQFRNEDGKGIAWRPGGVMVGLYEQVKQVKFLANSQLSPKLAFVMTAPAGTSWQRTILFGDSAPPFKAEPTIETVQVDGITTTHFFLKIPNNRESLSVPIPPGVSSNFVLHLVKSLPSGVAIYDRYTKETF